MALGAEGTTLHEGVDIFIKRLMASISMRPSNGRKKLLKMTKLDRMQNWTECKGHARGLGNVAALHY